MSLLSGLNWLDIALLFALIAGLAVGYIQGLLRQLVGLAALYIGAILGAQYYLLVANLIFDFFPQAPIRFVNALSFFVILLFVTSVINWLVYDTYRSTRLRLFPIVDYLGGAVLGLLTTAVILTVLLPVIAFATGEMWPWGETARLALVNGLETARLTPIFELAKPRMLNALSPWLPGGLPSIFNL